MRPDDSRTSTNREVRMPKLEVEKIPHSWELKNWPANVWPHHGEKVKWLIISKKTELMKCGALVRPGRLLVVLGAQYLGWLQRQSSRVDDFDIAPNVARKAAQAVAYGARRSA
jgi:hypothetical protein